MDRGEFFEQVKFSDIYQEYGGGYSLFPASVEKIHL